MRAAKGSPHQPPLKRSSSATLCTLTHEDEPGAGQLGPLKEGVEHVLAFALQLVQLIQHQEAVGEPISTPALSPHSPSSRESRAAASLLSWHPGESHCTHHRQGTHTMGPLAVRCFSRLRIHSRPVATGSPRCCARAGKTLWGLPSAMQFSTTVLLPASLSCQEWECYTGPTPLSPSPHSSPTAVAMAQTLQSSRTRLRQAVFPVPGAPDT